jgi:hypothetical protein
VLDWAVILEESQPALAGVAAVPHSWQVPSDGEPKPGAMPADNGFRFHNYQHPGLPGPDAAQGRPEQPAQRIQPRTRPFPLERGDLLPQGEYLDCSVMPTAEEDLGGGQLSNGEFEHEPCFVT